VCSGTVSYVVCHMSYRPCRMSHVACHMSHVALLSGRGRERERRVRLHTTYDIRHTGCRLQRERAATCYIRHTTYDYCSYGIQSYCTPEPNSSSWNAFCTCRIAALVDSPSFCCLRWLIGPCNNLATMPLVTCLIGGFNRDFSI
jgi:hypothetical protein